jgi:(S)-2-hydroxy-acid oxidase
MIVSCGPSIMLEELADKETDVIKWSQIYIFEDRNVTLDLVKRAERLGFKALVLTIDRPVLGVKFTSKNIEGFDNGVKLYKKNLEYGDNYLNYTSLEVATDVTWNDLKWLKSQTHLPIVVKGVLTGEDARMAVENGADGVLVSNHGGRQLDELPATVSLLSCIFI